MNRFERLLKRLDLQQASDNVFVGGAGEGGVGAEARLFGGLVAAQAAMAAQRACPRFPMHSLHSYFLHPGRPERDIEYHATRTKAGRNFEVVEVHARQGESVIFQLLASFQQPAPNVRHQDPTPALNDPTSYPNRDQLKGRAHWADMPIDVRMVTPITADEALPPDQQVWLKTNGILPEDAHLQLAMVVYASDRSLLDTAWRPHADRGEMVGASLDHSMWFHHPPRFDDWLLYDIHSPAAADSRGLALGAIYDRAGVRVVTVAQEGVMRTR
ncbi:MAG: acyl-CoA thioesterase domain-containing protein [Pseudomonadota bacterium]